MPAPSRSELMSMNKEDLADAVDKAVTRAQKIKEKGVVAAKAILEFVFAGAGGAVVGYWLGSIQREINAGTEGYDEDSLKIFGVDKDLGAGLAMAGLSAVKGLKKFRGPLRAGGMGALSFWTGRKAYNNALEKEVEEEEDDA